MDLSPFTPLTLFELEGWEHADLFDGCETAWQAIGAPLRTWLERALASRCGEGGRVIEGEVEDGAALVGDGIVIGPGSRVETGACVRGPCLIGRDVEVRHGAYLRGHVLVGDSAIVGHATEAKGSVFLPGAKAGHFAYVGDSILGRGVNLGAGTKLANLRLADDEVSIRWGEHRVATGLRKLGAILGDGAQTGCNAVTNPGTVLGRGALVHPCVVASGAHAAGAVVRARS